MLTPRDQSAALSNQVAMEKAHFCLCDVGVVLETDCPSFVRFAEQYLLHFRQECEPRIRATVLFPSAPEAENQHSKRLISREGDLLGYGVRGEEGQITWSQVPNLTVEFTKSFDGYRVTCIDRYWPRRTRRRFWRPPLPNLHRFQTVLRYAIHYPLFWLLERERGIYILHGSAIESGGQGMLFVGLAGVGKSSLALALIASGAARFITDNFLLYDQEKIIPFPEIVRVTPTVKDLVSNRESLGKPTFAVNERLYLNLPRGVIGEPVRPRYAFILSLSNRTLLTEIAREQFADIALRLGDYVQEFHNYSYPGLLPLVLPENQAVYRSRYDNLLLLLEDAACYMLRLEQGQGLVEIWQEIERSI
jgi:hypothetical protein